MPPRIAILTLVVGNDYRKAMEPGLASKREYAARHGYTYLQGNDDDWDRSKPIPWSKFRFILKHLDAYDFLFWSDADAIILNQDLRLEDQVASLLPPQKDLVWTFDACKHYNNGHMWIRGGSAWARDYFQRAFEQHELTYHIWWDNAAMIKLYDTVPEDRDKIETCYDYSKFNSYLFGLNDKSKGNAESLYQPGEFILHFAGVYQCWNIYRMMKYIKHQVANKKSLNYDMLDKWRSNPIQSKAEADASLTEISIPT
jgi:hypothetical protein